MIILIMTNVYHMANGIMLTAKVVMLVYIASLQIWLVWKYNLLLKWPHTMHNYSKLSSFKF